MTATSGIEDIGKGGDEPYLRRYTSDELLEFIRETIAAARRAAMANAPATAGR